MKRLILLLTCLFLGVSVFANHSSDVVYDISSLNTYKSNHKIKGVSLEAGSYNMFKENVLVFEPCPKTSTHAVRHAAPNSDGTVTITITTITTIIYCNGDSRVETTSTSLTLKAP